MKRQYLLLLAIILFTTIIISCKQNKSGEMIAPNLFFEYKEKQHLSEIISDIEYIRLETNDSCLIGNIKQVLCYNDKFYILDSSTKSISVFSNKGQYTGKISSVGQGPGEYAMPHSMTIDKVHNMLYVNDVMQNKILIFDATSLKFESERFSTIEAQDFCFLNNDTTIAWYGISGINYNGKLFNYHIMISNLDNSILKNLIPVEFSTGYLLRPVSPFFQTDTSVIFSHPYQGIVYELSSQDSKELFTINFQKHKFPSVDYLKTNGQNSNFVKNIYQSGYVVFFNTFTTDNSSCINFYADNTYFMAVYNKRNAKGVYFPVNIVKNNHLENTIDDDMGILIYNNPTFCDGNYYYSLITPQSIVDKKENHIGRFHPQLQQIINELLI